MSGSKNVRFGLVLSEAARERLDRLARQQGCSRAELIDRALVNLEVVMARAVCRDCGQPTGDAELPRCFACAAAHQLRQINRNRIEYAAATGR